MVLVGQWSGVQAYHISSQSLLSLSRSFGIYVDSGLAFLFCFGLPQKRLHVRTVLEDLYER